ncbi:MAG: HAMP domain-containing protein [Chthonomonadaceae bacterium]|nr:HAMP domain-containing protein [Chthonomonadaceae bacterium]
MKARFRLFRSLRAQLAFFQGGILAVTLLLLSFFTLILLRQFLTSQADTRLRMQAEDTARGIAATLFQYSTQNPHVPLTQNIEETFVKNNELQTFGRYVQVINNHNNPVAFSDALRTTKFPPIDDALTSGLAKEVSYHTITSIGEYPVRIVTVPVITGERTPQYLVQVGASVEGVDVALQRATTILLILTPSVFLIALGGGWWLVGRALKPVDDMTRAALSIESKRLDLRVQAPRSDNEIGRLAGALNEMIARLDRSFRQIERFSADASHELKTPLTTIRGEAEVALMSDELTPDLRRTFESVIEETERMSSIVNNLLLLSKADADQVKLAHEPLQLEEVAMACYESMERLAHRKHLTLDIENMDDAPIFGDKLWLGQLITNLLINALNYTPEGRSVFLSVTRDDTGGKLVGFVSPTPDISLEAPVAVLTVRDTGTGIGEEHLPFLFDRFYRVDSGRSRDQGGSGLGLNIARWIAESHNGQIGVKSIVGEGTTFMVRIPMTTLSQDVQA